MLALSREHLMAYRLHPERKKARFGHLAQRSLGRVVPETPPEDWWSSCGCTNHGLIVANRHFLRDDNQDFVGPQSISSSCTFEKAVEPTRQKEAIAVTRFTVDVMAQSI